jgi:hypothetical protein
MTNQQILTREQIGKFFDEIVFGFIYHDLGAAICGKANYLAALGLVAYTEFMGGLVHRTLGEPGKSEARFREFLTRMGPEYAKKADAIYDESRSGLVHQYFIAADSTVQMHIGGDRGLTCGVEEHDGKTYFIVEKYYRDFKTACEQYYRDLLDACDGAGDTSLLENFSKAVGDKWFKEPVLNA